MQRGKAADTVNTSKGVAVPKAARDRVRVSPRDVLPWDTGEGRRACEQVSLLSLLQLFFLCSSFSSDHRGVEPSLEEHSLGGGWNCLEFPLVVPSELNGYSPGYSLCL